MKPAKLRRRIERHFQTTLGRSGSEHSDWYMYLATAMAVRDRVFNDWRRTKERRRDSDDKRVFYLSMEFLLGRALNNTLRNLHMEGPAAQALCELGADLEEIEAREVDAGLGNGGLGRLAACFLDSCASMDLPVTGYGLRYDYGMFHQVIDNGYQLEQPDHWLLRGYPWEIERFEISRCVHFFGRSEAYHDDSGALRYRWVDTSDVIAVPYDLPIPGDGNGVVNTLRLWSSEATDRFDLGEFNAGSYAESVAQKNAADNITMVLYPNDASENGKTLRLQQQYFLASASLQDILAQWVELHGEDFSDFADRHCFQLNDTHPAISVAELMRLLVDEHRLDWDTAWDITTRTMAYTNHTLLPEALEVWSVALFERMLPRVLDIIREINARFLTRVAARWPGDHERQSRMSIISDGWHPQVRMAHLAVVGSFSVNGVAALHSDLLKAHLFSDFHALTPAKFNNKTNGVSPRRWLAYCNPGIAELISDTIGTTWRSELCHIEQLAAYADDPGVQARWAQVRQDNKRRLAAYVLRKTGVTFDPAMMVDVQVKRIHEYKRQLLNVLHVIHLVNRIHAGDIPAGPGRFVLIGGKAAPGYAIAKKIIKLINNVARAVNNDPVVSPYLRMAFLPNYSVTAMEAICPAADLSEQISTAGKEASGTGNMKLMMNGAVTIGTADGANIEILERVGEEAFFLFGLNAEEVIARRQGYHPDAIIAADPDLSAVMNLLENGHFNLFEPGIFDDIIGAVRSPSDPWMLAADFRAFIDAQRRVEAAFADQPRWLRMSILNTARSCFFSSDRTIAEYDRDIWRVRA
ncbi:MAG: glycogen/starch/alpha-glucan phosphorylase [Pseudomonadales bacterium]|nr:glycogen/starch/alpha-glucan phosphorylase [Pseudomonadales bacterium]